MATDDERGETLLTPTMRQWLRSEEGEEPYSGSHLRANRKRWRDRIREGLVDFEYLADPDGLPDRDLQQIRQLKQDNEVVTETFHGRGGEVTDEPIIDPEIEQALVEMVAFIFRVKPGPDYFESVIRAGLERALERHPTDAILNEVTVSIEVPDRTIERIERFLDEGFPLTDAECRIALEENIRDPDAIAEHLREHGTRQEGISPEGLKNLKESMEEWADPEVDLPDDLPEPGAMSSETTDDENE